MRPQLNQIQQFVNLNIQTQAPATQKYASQTQLVALQNVKQDDLANKKSVDSVAETVYASNQKQFTTQSLSKAKNATSVKIMAVSDRYNIKHKMGQIYSQVKAKRNQASIQT